MSSQTSSAPRAVGSGIALGVAMGLGNAISYAFVLILTRVLGPSDFGAYSSVNTIGIVLAIPAGAFQVIVARRWNTAEERTSGLVAALGMGIVLMALTCGLSPILANLLHLDSIWPVVAMSFMLVPMTVTGAFQGMLLGSGELRSLAWLYIVTALTRLAAACLCALAAATVTEVFWATAVASWVAAGFGLWCCRAALGTLAHHSSTLLIEMVRSNSTLAAFTALTNVDVVLVRHFLDAHTSGGYGLASTFGRAMCWGTQFVALLIVPRLGAHGAKVLWRAAGLIVGLGLVALALAALAPETLVRLVGGASYTGFGTLVVACIALGTVWALCQLWLFSSMAGNSAVLGTVTWTMVAVELVVGWFWLHANVWQIVGLSGLCSVTVVVAGMWHTVTGARKTPVTPAVTA